MLLEARTKWFYTLLLVQCTALPYKANLQPGLAGLTLIVYQVDVETKSQTCVAEDMWGPLREKPTRALNIFHILGERSEGNFTSNSKELVWDQLNFYIPTNGICSFQFIEDKTCNRRI